MNLEGFGCAVAYLRMYCGAYLVQLHEGARSLTFGASGSMYGLHKVHGYLNLYKIGLVDLSGDIYCVETLDKLLV